MSANESTEWGRDYLVFAMTGHEYAIEHERTIETRRCEVRALSTVPEGLAYLSGTAIIDEHRVPVVDLRAKLGLALDVKGDDSVLVFVRIHGEVIGLRVGDEIALIILKDDQVSREPRASLPIPAPYVVGTANAGFRTFLLLDVDRLVDAGELAQLMAAIGSSDD